MNYTPFAKTNTSLKDGQLAEVDELEYTFTDVSLNDHGFFDVTLNFEVPPQEFLRRINAEVRVGDIE